VGWREIAHNDVPVGGDGVTAVIVGSTPSRGARSPLLWNAAFDDLGIAGRMVPVDIDAEGLPGLITALDDDPDMIGGAVTMPFKAAVIPHLAGVSGVATAAGAVNCLFRSANGGTGLHGENTDGIAALRSVERCSGDVTDARVLLLGAGGAGSAVAAAFARALGPSGALVVANRDPAARDLLVERLRASSAAPVSGAPGWPVATVDPGGAFDVIINATSLGFQLPLSTGAGWLPARLATPVAGTDGYPDLARDAAQSATAGQLGDVLARAILRTLEWLDAQSGALVFDIVYQPERTLLLALAETAGCRTMNGSWMNLEQAVIAFCTAVPTATGRDVDPDDVRGAMLAATEASA
jgi:shikimate dehydrogenase